MIKRRRAWEWQLRDQAGVMIMGGREKTRPAARYQGYRALFMLLASSWRSSGHQAPQSQADSKKFRHTQ